MVAASGVRLPLSTQPRISTNESSTIRAAAVEGRGIPAILWPILASRVTGRDWVAKWTLAVILFCAMTHRLTWNLSENP
jgi:hypothetical protein